MLKIDYSVLIQIANFLILLFLLNALLYKPIRNILNRRKEKIRDYEEKIKNYQDNSAMRSKELEEGAAGARKEGFGEKEGLQNEAQEEEKEMVRNATATAGQKIDKAKEEMEKALESARRTLESEVDLFSKELAEKILGRAVR